MHPLQGVSFLGTPLQGGILKPPALRVVDDCINSEISRIYILTQFNSASLNRHIARTYAWAGAGFSPGFVEVLAAQQTPDSPSWFAGTADAVRQYLGVFAEWDVDQ